MICWQEVRVGERIKGSSCAGAVIFASGLDKTSRSELMEVNREGAVGVLGFGRFSGEEINPVAASIRRGSSWFFVSDSEFYSYTGLSARLRLDASPESRSHYPHLSNYVLHGR